MQEEASRSPDDSQSTKETPQLVSLFPHKSCIKKNRESYVTTVPQEDSLTWSILPDHLGGFLIYSVIHSTAN